MQPDKQMNRAGCLGKLYRPVGWCIACITAVLLALLCFIGMDGIKQIHLRGIRKTCSKFLTEDLTVLS